MNERVRELAEQAGFFPERNWDHTGWHAAGHNDTFEKFAELIVTDVIDILTTYRTRMIFDDGFEYNCEHPINAISRHFGVEP